MWYVVVPSIIAVAGLVTVFERWCERGPVARKFTADFRRSGKSTEKQVGKDVAQAIVKVIGSVHLAIQIPLALMVVRDPHFQADRLYSTSGASYTMLVISAGYFLHDAVTCIRNYEDWGFAYLVHAVSCCMLYSYGAGSGFLHYFGAAFLLWECSTPFVYLRWYLWKIGLERTRWYLINGLTMTVVFFLCRNAYGLVISYEYWSTTSAELSHLRSGGLSVMAIWLYRVGNIALNTLNAFWFYKMLSGALKVLAGGNPNKTHQR